MRFNSPVQNSISYCRFLIKRISVEKIWMPAIGRNTCPWKTLLLAYYFIKFSSWQQTSWCIIEFSIFFSCGYPVKMHSLEKNRLGSFAKFSSLSLRSLISCTRNIFTYKEPFWNSALFIVWLVDLDCQWFNLSLIFIAPVPLWIAIGTFMEWFPLRCHPHNWNINSILDVFTYEYPYSFIHYHPCQ